MSSLAAYALTRTEVRGAEHLPREGGALLMANHISHFDPNFLGMRLPRPVDYMADLPLLRLPVAGRILKSWNAFPVDRTKPVDRAAIRTALERIKAGRVVGIFPEKGLRYGARSILGGAELPAGSAALWQMAQVPVVPALIFGTDQLYQWRNLFRRPRVFIWLGPALSPMEKESREAARDRIATAIRALYATLEKESQPAPREYPRAPQERFKER